MNESIHINLPRDLLAGVEEKWAKEVIVCALVREQRISTGRAAEVLGVSKGEMAQILARHHTNYFTETPEEIREQVREAERKLDV